MYSYFKGIITEKSIDNVVLEVNNIGYLINVSQNDANRYLMNKEHIVYVHHVVRETEMELYGFKSKEDLKIFKKLISISKIGPKTALNVLSLYSAAQLIKIVAEGDIDSLSKVSGIGKKGAARIIIELKGKINFEAFDDDNYIQSGFLVTVSDALKNLGYDPDSIKKVCKVVEKKFDEKSNIEEVITYAIQNIGK